jgi:hypothetical protein
LRVIDRLRRWLRSDILVWRWVFLALYIALVVAATWFAIDFFGETAFFLICLAVMLVAQVLFIFGAGTIHLCRPIRRRRLVMPVVVAAFMFTVLLSGLSVAMLEFVELDGYLSEDWGAIAFWLTMTASWIGWGVVLFTHTREMARLKAVSRMSNMLIVGSLAELLACVPAHVVVTRRPGCLVGIGTMMGIIAGLCVMFFAFGPAIVLLFLRPRYRREQMESSDGAVICGQCGYDCRASRERCPECGTPIRADRAVR